MFRSGAAVAAIALVGLFGYYFVTDTGKQSKVERAKSAAAQVGDTVRDKGVASLVDVRLKAKFGLDATRFLHSYYDNGRVVVYGLVPDGIDLARIHEEALKVTGVREADVFVSPRPAFITPLKALPAKSAPAATDETP